MLLIEPFAPLARALRTGLEEEGAAVVQAGAKDADTLARAGGFDVVVVDLNTPADQGLARVRGWRKDGLLTPVLLLTDAEEVLRPAASPDLGRFATLAKPFPFEQLFEYLRTLTGLV